MDTANLKNLLTELFDEIQDLRANQRLLNHALEKAGLKMSIADASDLKQIFLKEAESGVTVNVIRKRIEKLGEE
jgi:hypothetical protein